MGHDELTRSSTVQLTKYPAASLRELTVLALPLMVSAFSMSLAVFCDRVFLARYSIQVLEGCVNGIFFIAPFQISLMRIASTGQVFTGFHNGRGRCDVAAQSIWQMIWFSLLSMLVTLPLGLFVGPFFLQGTAADQSALEYFQCLLWVNFLFPLGAALSSFYIGLGRIQVVLLATLSTCLLNIALDYFLIFGVGSLIPPLGALGAALASAAAQGAFCMILFINFIGKSNCERYGTRNCALQWRVFWSYIRIGIPRALDRMVSLGAWAAAARMITIKGGDFLLVLSIGNSVLAFFAFIQQGMREALLTTGSTLIGRGDMEGVKKQIRSAFLLLGCVMLILAIPLLIYPEMLLHFFPTDSSWQCTELLYLSCCWLWLWIASNGVGLIGNQLLIAACDTMFLMIVMCLYSLTMCVSLFFAMHVWHCSADKLWLIIALNILGTGIVCLLRVRKQKWRTERFALPAETGVVDLSGP